jgi:hypothetical protein
MQVLSVSLSSSMGFAHETTLAKRQLSLDVGGQDGFDRRTLVARNTGNITKRLLEAQAEVSVAHSRLITQLYHFATADAAQVVFNCSFQSSHSFGESVP